MVQSRLFKCGNIERIDIHRLHSEVHCHAVLWLGTHHRCILSVHAELFA